MALPTSYLTSTKNLEAILNAIKGAQAPDKFTQGFLESLEFKGSADRLVIGVLKSLKFLDEGGKPTERYFRFLDQTQSPKVLAEGIREAYQDLFRVNTKADGLSKTEVVNKFKTLSQGQLSDAVLDKMAMTFLALGKHADFSGTPVLDAIQSTSTGGIIEQEGSDPVEKLKISGLVYTIQIVLPESRDPAVYDALFQSLRRHLE